MSPPDLARWLREAGAHHDVVSWAAPYGPDWSRAFAECPRGDWLLAIALRLGAPREDLLRAASACARAAGDYGASDDPHGRSALEAAQAFLRGEVTAEVCAAAAKLAEEAAEGCGDAAAASSIRAAAAAAHATADLDLVPMAAALAVEAAVLDAGDCAMMSAMGYMHERCAEAVREAVDLHGLAPAPTDQGR